MHFSISEKMGKMRMISFNERYVAGPESNQQPLDPLAIDARRLSGNVYMSRRMTKQAKWPLRQKKTQISLGIRLV